MERLTKRNPTWIDDEFWLSAEEPDDEEIDAVYRKLKDYEDAEEQGLLARLPCKAGDTVWTVNHNGGVCSHQIRRFERNKDGDFACSMLMLPLKGFGKTVFPTREEAEKVLKEANPNG